MMCGRCDNRLKPANELCLYYRVSHLLLVSLNTFDNVLKFLNQSKLIWLISIWVIFDSAWEGKLDKVLSLKIVEHVSKQMVIHKHNFLYHIKVNKVWTHVFVYYESSIFDFGPNHLDKVIEKYCWLWYIIAWSRVYWMFTFILCFLCDKNSKHCSHF